MAPHGRIPRVSDNSSPEFQPRKRILQPMAHTADNIEHVPLVDNPRVCKPNFFSINLIVFGVNCCRCVGNCNENQ